MHAQGKMFKLYQDAAALTADANAVIKDFTVKVNAITPVMGVTPAAIVNTQPYLIFYLSKSNQVNLPVWREVIPEQKAFFTKLAGSAEDMRCSMLQGNLIQTCTAMNILLIRLPSCTGGKPGKRRS